MMYPDVEHVIHITYACAMKHMARVMAENSIKGNKALQMFLLQMASQKKCHVCCCKSSSRWYIVVENIVEDVKIVLMLKHRAIMRVCAPLVGEM